MEKLRRQVFDTIQIGNKRNLVSRIFDWVIVISTIYDTHPWNHSAVSDLVFPPQLLLVMVKAQRQCDCSQRRFYIKNRGRYGNRCKEL